MAQRCVPWDKRASRGNPTQEGEQVGVAFLLVTFLWPRKEKSLAKPRSGGETPSRTESSCPAWRSHTIQALGDIPSGNDVSPPHPIPLPQGERGRLPWCNALRLLHPTAHPPGRWDGYRGRLRFANRPYSTRFDLTHCLKRRIRMGHGQSPGGCRASRSRVKPSHLAAGAGDRLVSVKDAAAPDCRRHLAPLTIHEYSGPTGAYGHLTEPASAGPSKSMKLVMQPSELNGFSPLLQSSNRRLTQVRGVMEGEPQAHSPKPRAPS